MAGPSRLRQILQSAVIAPAGVAVLPHGLNVGGVPVLPEMIDIETSGFDVTAVTTTTITVKNNNAGALASRFEVQFRHSMVRADGPPVTGLFVPQSGTTFIRRGAGGGGGGGSVGNPQSFRYTVTGAEPDLSDFQVPLPAARANDVYRITHAPAGMLVIIPMDFPDIVAGDRTNVDFRLVAGAALTAGDQIDFHVMDPVP